MTASLLSINESDPKVSILIPTYNYGHFLDEAIQSALAQTFTNFELVIVDNHSTDNTEEVVSKYVKDKRVRYIRNEKNIGLVGNLNSCIHQAKGTYIKFLMADDKLHPKLLETFVPLMERNTTVSLITSFRAAFGTQTEIFTSPFKGLHKGPEVISECLAKGRGNLIGEPTTTMFRKSTLLKTGAFNSAFNCLADLDLWLRLLQEGDCYVVPEVLSYFRIHNGQASDNRNINNWFEEYHFYRHIRDSKLYPDCIKRSDLKKVLKKVALKCASIIYDAALHANRKASWQNCKEAIRIAAAENVLASSFFLFITQGKKYINRYKLAAPAEDQPLLSAYPKPFILSYHQP